MAILPRVTIRPVEKKLSNMLEKFGIHPLLAKLLASRGIKDINQVQYEWISLIPPNYLNQANKAARHLADAITKSEKILIVADYDCDGATACAVGIRALRAMGANVDFIVPNRFKNGYGLSIDIVEQILSNKLSKPDIILTVDNGISSIDGIEYANKNNIQVIVTDHHLPGIKLPNALSIVNPNHPNCNFPSKNLSGVGVIFYLMIELRAEMRRRKIYRNNTGPKLNELVDLVALGTIADMVKLDANNRLLVTQGLNRIRNGCAQPGIKALFKVANKQTNNADSSSLGFYIAPRLNAAGRLYDMSLGILCLITDNYDEALKISTELDNINKCRRCIENKMNEEALSDIADYEFEGKNTICIYNEKWHTGIVGLVASKLKERFWKPTIVFADSENNEIRGSARSVMDLNIKDILDIIAKNHPNIIKQFGGHAMAAGLTINSNNYFEFTEIFENVVKTITSNSKITPTIETDGSLKTEYINLDISRLLKKQVWGSGFPSPIFIDSFKVISQKTIKDTHKKLILMREKMKFDAIWFNHTEYLPENIKATYRIDENIWDGKSNLQLLLEHIYTI
ncbi:single-stranded-DNA-specific exonuclease RecJ [Candidatus Kinetoplastibacterium blastocrithidii TCC012E]|uniref:Single-stranded-DNA-specific exonuclease RecJ n=1 Tax=Candidatus Kinetoplastidibacterium blastocrithidiae TCC012E TaxID=1208922 RepID=M1LW21_9PROT|nr:single-stranded-DNA-specific exonuclease RecJ [Candidatus Kinetoplastibacterium blastocrithidii]AFZ83616.1 single-stranded-DNA-specific exonuclease [Candidatus Kinetoplastibacterium blastocrithidii (ex Strigomonas culicis)]AGF49737.1 single-stranded-DNA-specific exonuclease RecJ [Candidatus Kinetoplastibacterium blastocrithidii TCC012E]